MLVIGLTGGIGSGKSSVARILATLGATVIDTDEIAHRLTAKGTPALAAVIEQFGSSYQLPDGNLDRARLRKLVFSDHAAKAKLETLLHPLIKQQVVAEKAETRGLYLVLVVPLFFETRAYRDLVDRVLVVDCDENQQISRTMSRSQLSAEEVRSIMAHQTPRTERTRQADDILFNLGNLADLEKHVQEMHRHYEGLAACLT
ncbi:MAG: dephospho-CoA kinase [Betaproteobacteria bacterium CG2_30_59_46]|nr:MAG: dephospho-CoA kinase [Betaproteobacteria bacterium CG2_30_59_46]